MSRSHFIILLRRYQDGTASPAEIRVVEQWYAMLEVPSREFSAQDWQQFEERLWFKLQEELFKTEVSTPKAVKFWRGYWLRIAASIFIVAGLYYVFNQNNRTVSIKQEIADAKKKGLELVVNATSKPLVVTLEDKSKVTLNPQSEVRFPIHFATDKREVYLSGEAFFEVSENANRPFMVYTGSIVTRVLGTSFRVKAPDAQSVIEVSVKTGKVTVYQAHQRTNSKSSRYGNGVILSPNHKVVFSPENKIFVTSLVDTPVVSTESLSSVSFSFNFDDTPLIEVLNCLEKAYSIDIEVENKNLYNCPLTANLGGKSLYSQLDIICAAIEGSYEVKGTTILVSGKGCD